MKSLSLDGISKLELTRSASLSACTSEVKSTGLLAPAFATGGLTDVFGVVTCSLNFFDGSERSPGAAVGS